MFTHSEESKKSNLRQPVRYTDSNQIKNVKIQVSFHHLLHTSRINSSSRCSTGTKIRLDNNNILFYYRTNSTMKKKNGLQSSIPKYGHWKKKKKKREETTILPNWIIRFSAALLVGMIQKITSLPPPSSYLVLSSSNTLPVTRCCRREKTLMIVTG